MHYARLSLIVATLAFRLLRIHMVGYIDVFGEIPLSELLGESQVAFLALRCAIGAALKPGKAEAGKAIVSLGFQRGPPTANDRHRKISLPREKATKWASLIDETIKSGNAQRDSTGKLVG